MNEIFKWYKLFTDVQESIENNPRVSWTSISRTDENVQCVREVLNSDRRLSVLIIADETDIDKMMMYKIATENCDAKELRQIGPESLDRRPKPDAIVWNLL